MPLGGSLYENMQHLFVCGLCAYSEHLLAGLYYDTRPQGEKASSTLVVWRENTCLILYGGKDNGGRGAYVSLIVAQEMVISSFPM